MEDIQFMQQAIALAKKGKGHVNPNPLVGAVLVKDGTIIGKGYHEQYGQLHAERNALKDCKVSPEGAVLYVTLEPCNHHGKTPPCTEAIIENGIAKVVIGTLDPNPHDCWRAGRRMQRSDPCVPQVHHDGAAICIDEICHDHGWKDCYLYRSIQMDYRGKGAGLCAGDAQ